MGNNNQSKKVKSGLSVSVDLKYSKLFKVILNHMVNILKDERLNDNVLNEHYNSLIDSCNELNENKSSTLSEEIEVAISNITSLIEDIDICYKCKEEYSLLLSVFKSIRILIFEKENSIISLQNLYAAQLALNKYIFFKKKVDERSSRVLEDNLLAMIVEVSELANSIRCFKHWSNKGQDPREVQLMEYVDVFHFFLNIGNILGFTHEEVEQAYIEKYLVNISRQNTGY